MTKESVICELVAKIYENRDWHKLMPVEKDLVKKLELLGYLNGTDKGYIGKACAPNVELTGRGPER